MTIVTKAEAMRIKAKAAKKIEDAVSKVEFPGFTEVQALDQVVSESQHIKTSERVTQ